MNQREKREAGCIANLSKCGAECCKRFYIKLDLDTIKQIGKDKLLIINTRLSNDQKNYYELHECRYERGNLYIRVEDFKILNDGLVLFYKSCKALNEELLCDLHDTDKQPRVCKTPNKNNYLDLKEVVVTENCVFKKGEEE